MLARDRLRAISLWFVLARRGLRRQRQVWRGLERYLRRLLAPDQLGAGTLRQRSGADIPTEIDLDADLMLRVD